MSDIAERLRLGDIRNMKIETLAEFRENNGRWVPAWHGERLDVHGFVCAGEEGQPSHHCFEIWGYPTDALSIERAQKLDKEWNYPHTMVPRQWRLTIGEGQLVGWFSMSFMKSYPERGVARLSLASRPAPTERQIVQRNEQGTISGLLRKLAPARTPEESE